MAKFRSELGSLVDPKEHTESLDLTGRPTDLLRQQLRTMLLIRVVEEVIGDMVVAGQVKCPCHLGIGQEAVAVGVSEYLRPTDRVFGNHRSHSHYLALNGSVDGLFGEVLGKATGCSRGMGGSMHLNAANLGFQGAVPIVGGTVPIAVGAGLAAKMDGCGGLAVTYFGDGTIEEGVVQESLNLASALDLPVLFVCENNLYSSHLDIRYRQPSDRIARFADAHHIPAHSVDGNNLLAVSNAARELIERARTGGGPGFLEAVTYRWCGHVGPDENVDVGLRRKREDLDAWKGRDPIRRLAEGLAACGVVRQEEFERMGQEVRERVLKARDQALDAPYPEPDALLGLVYREGYPLKIP